MFVCGERIPILGYCPIGIGTGRRCIIYVQAVFHYSIIASSLKVEKWLQLKLSFTVGPAKPVTLTLLCGFLPIIFYLLAALGGSMIPANSGWYEPDKGVDIFIESNGVHVGLVLPVSEGGEDLSDLVRPEHLANPMLYGTHLLIGWGHAGVYRNTPQWQDLRVEDAFSAIFGSDETLLHIYHLITPTPNGWRRHIRVRPEEYRKIISQIRADFKRGANGSGIAHPAYGPDNLFYEADGHYSAFFTCNVWTARILRNAGIRIGIWPPFAGGVMRWFPE